MAKEEFIDLLDFTDDLPHEADETLDSVLKDDKMTDTEFVEQVCEKEELQNDEFTIKLHKVDAEKPSRSSPITPKRIPALASLGGRWAISMKPSSRSIARSRSTPS